MSKTTGLNHAHDNRAIHHFDSFVIQRIRLSFPLCDTSLIFWKILGLLDKLKVFLPCCDILPVWVSMEFLYKVFHGEFSEKLFSRANSINDHRMVVHIQWLQPNFCHWYLLNILQVLDPNGLGHRNRMF